MARGSMVAASGAMTLMVCGMDLRPLGFVPSAPRLQQKGRELHAAPKLRSSLSPLFCTDALALNQAHFAHRGSHRLESSSAVQAVGAFALSVSLAAAVAQRVGAIRPGAAGGHSRTSRSRTGLGAASIPPSGSTPPPRSTPPPKAFDPKTEVGATAPLGFFDPLGICPKDETVFNEYRACEIKHGRVAMMAAVGAVAQHFIRFPGFDKTNFGEPMPAGVTALFYSPGSFGFVFLMIISAVLELVLWKDGVDTETGRWTKEPGNFGDPLGLGQYTEDMRNRELNNGRIAMFATFGIIAAEAATGKDGIQQLGF